MKTFFLLIGLASGMSLVRADDGDAAPVQPSLVTITTNAVAAPQAPVGRVFTLKPVGVLKDVERLAQAGTDPAVIKSYVQSWPTPYTLNANDILHLHDIGVPSDVLTTLIQHGSELGAHAQAMPSAPPPVPPPDGTAAPEAYPYPEQPAPNYLDPNYASSYPYYVPYYAPYYVPTYSYSLAYDYWPYWSWYWPYYSFGFYGFYGRHGYRGYHYPYYQHGGSYAHGGSYGHGIYAHGSYGRGPYAHSSSGSGSYAQGSYTRGSYAHGSYAARPTYSANSFAGRSFVPHSASQQIHSYPQHQAFSASRSFSAGRPAMGGFSGGRSFGGGFSGGRSSGGGFSGGHGGGRR